MNRTRLKSYAPKARLDFLRAVTDRACKIGITATQREPVTVHGDYAMIAGQPFPRIVSEQRRKLDERIARLGFHAVMEEAAYTWFNRFMAIRYMELHGYFDHGFRVLSHPEGCIRPEVLEQAEHLRLPGLDKARVIDLKLDGTKDEELYRVLLLAQFHALHLAMPFLFARIDDQTELLLPDNLLATDSVIRKMVEQTDEEDWEQIEVIGWLYQFYITEEKARVDAELKAGKAVASRDIPAKTQLFTPNWIVKYIVQNSLGRQWMATYPHSPLRTQMEYYIEPAEQTEEVKAQLAAITPNELDPETLTLIDPACGSGHILCEAYDLFKEIYLERGYRLRDIPRLILEKNLYGLDIDDRAAQMAGFALLMKARADDRRILDNGPNLNVIALQSSAGLNGQEIVDALLLTETFELVPNTELFPETKRQLALTADITPIANGKDLHALLELFANAKTLGSLLTVVPALSSRLPNLRALLDAHRGSSDLLKQQAVADLEPLVTQAEFLAHQYDVSVTNPPYMGSKGMNAELKDFAGKAFPNSKADLFAMFIERGFVFAKPYGFNALVTMQSWMFLSSYEVLRKDLLETKTLHTMAHLGAHAFAEIGGEVVQVTTFVAGNKYIPCYTPVFIRTLNEDEASKAKAIREGSGRHTSTIQDDFRKIPGSPIAYWTSASLRNLFASSKPLVGFQDLKQGLATCNNDLFVRSWQEVSTERVHFNPEISEEIRRTMKWFPFIKGGENRKWYGNYELLVNWERNGEAIHKYNGLPLDYNGAPLRAKKYYFREGLNWSSIGSGGFSVRYSRRGSIFGTGGSSGFSNSIDINYAIGFLNSKVCGCLLNALSTTLNIEVGQVSAIPFKNVASSAAIVKNTKDLIEIARCSWDGFETSWDFKQCPLTCNPQRMLSVSSAWETWKSDCQISIARMRDLEQENNRLLIEAYGLLDELTSDVPDEQITLARASLEEDMRRLLSYAIGCMMGRYSLDESGLIYAHSGNKSFNHARYSTYPADDDGILPLTDTDWFGAQDTANRFADFLRVAWPPESLTANLKFVADSLGPKADEAPIETIRRYLCTGFLKDHFQIYKRRPIYWLFSSGKERAFQALVYLHRYNEGTLSRMRIEYVIPLQSRLSAHIDQLKDDITASVTTADRKKREKEREKLLRQQEELRTFDEKLRHAADQRISLDLDDGVKVNYGKFGDLLAEVKAVTGGSDE
jgi:type II restriction/modification system DNA methylase subunit YeeA